MEPGDLTYFAEEPWTLLVILPLVGLCVWLALDCLRLLGVVITSRGRTAAMSVALVLTPFVPARALALGLRSMVVIPIAVGVVAIVSATPWGRRTYVLPKTRRAL